MDKNKNSKGYTLIEIVIAITLMSILLIVLFGSINALRSKAAKIEKKTGIEKEVYLFFNRFSHLVKHRSSIQVFNNISISSFFWGNREEMIFISRHPLFYPYRIPHYVNVAFHQNRLEYREKIFLQPAKKAVNFDFSDSPRDILLKDVSQYNISYWVEHPDTGKIKWKHNVNTFEGDQIPGKIKISFTFGRKHYQFVFRGFIND